MNKLALKITITLAILTISFTASATGGGKKPDPSFHQNQLLQLPSLASLHVQANTSRINKKQQ